MPPTSPQGPRQEKQQEAKRRRQLQRLAGEIRRLDRSVKCRERSIERLGKQTVRDAYHAGLRILKAKSICVHREFGPWQRSTGLKRGTSDNYRSLAEYAVDSKSKLLKISNMGLTAAYAYCKTQIARNKKPRKKSSRLDRGSAFKRAVCAARTKAAPSKWSGKFTGGRLELKFSGSAFAKDPITAIRNALAELRGFEKAELKRIVSVSGGISFDVQFTRADALEKKLRTQKRGAA